MRFHKGLVLAVTDTLRSIFEEGIYADKAVEHVLKSNPKWGSRDRRFIAETVYDMVRWWRLIQFSLHGEKNSDNPNYMTLFAVWMILKGEQLPDWEEFASIHIPQVIENRKKAEQIRCVRNSFPDWMDDLLEKELGAEVTEKEEMAMNEQASVVLRVNRLKTDPSKLKAVLTENGLNCLQSPDYPDALLLQERKSLQTLDAYKKGWFEIQDASSQLIAAQLDVLPGMTVVDACAGAGGKSLHAAALMQNKGKLLAMDVEERKLLELERRAERAGVKIIQTKVIRPGIIAGLKETADRLLLDVPCSGIGVLKRNPDSKWKLSSSFLNEIKQTQAQLLREYSTMLKPGGIMIYATCSILPSENQDQVQAFLQSHPGYELLLEQRILPSQGYDGFYLAKLKKSR